MTIFLNLLPARAFRRGPPSVLHVIDEKTAKILNFISLDGMHGDINLILHLAQAIFNLGDIAYNRDDATGDVDSTKRSFERCLVMHRAR